MIVVKVPWFAVDHHAQVIGTEGDYAIVAVPDEHDALAVLHEHFEVEIIDE